MADFNKAFDTLMKLEWSNCKDALHKNEGEEGYTFMGVYQKAHPDSVLWEILDDYKFIEDIDGEPDDGQLKRLSILMCNNTNAMQEVKKIYRSEYWNRAKLYDVQSQKIAEEIFVFGVNAGIERAIKLAQRIVGVKPDGIVGVKTLAALNSYNGKLFDILFDAGEARYYESLVRAKEKFARYEDGWLNRAKAV